MLSDKANFNIGEAANRTFIFEHYKLSSEMARQAIDRRIEVSKFFVTTFGAALAGLVAVVKIFEERPAIIALISLIVSSAGILLALNWRSWIVFLVNQSSCRQEVLEEFEDLLPTAHWRPINARLEREGWDSKELERRVPVAFLWGTVVIALISAASLFGIAATKDKGTQFVDLFSHQPRLGNKSPNEGLPPGVGK